jgi:hypothetical protein
MKLNKRKVSTADSWCAHKKPYGKRIANKKMRRIVKKDLEKQVDDTEDSEAK